AIVIMYVCPRGIGRALAAPAFGGCVAVISLGTLGDSTAAYGLTIAIYAGFVWAFRRACPTLVTKLDFNEVGDETTS
ncbi:MAG: hypothetical protein WBC93_01865, partial [Sulfitobacter sp.]